MTGSVSYIIYAIKAHQDGVHTAVAITFPRQCQGRQQLLRSISKDVFDVHSGQRRKARKTPPAHHPHIAQSSKHLATRSTNIL